jgi:hypothetical protein
MTTANQPSQYEMDRIQRNRTAREEAGRLEIREAFCRDRERVMTLGSQATVIQANMEAYDNPGGELRPKTRAARKWLGWFAFTVFLGVLIANADFFLGMPDVSEPLAYKAASLLNQLDKKLPGDCAVSPTSPIIRISCGVLVVLMWLGITVGWKACTNTASLKSSLATLAPGDDERFRSLKRSIRMCWAGRAVYMVVFAGLLSFLYTFDLEKARLVVSNLQVEESTQADDLFKDFDLNLSGNTLTTNEATPQAVLSAPKTTPAALEESARKLARPQVLVYALLTMLHGLLLIIPCAERPDDLSLAFFDRGRAGRAAQNLRQQEGTMLRDLHTRIREANPSYQNDLVVEAMPIARRINETLGWQALEEPVGPVFGSSPTPGTFVMMSDAPLASDQINTMEQPHQTGVEHRQDERHPEAGQDTDPEAELRTLFG